LGSFQFRWLASLPLILATVILLITALNALVGASSPHAPLREGLFDYYQKIKPAPASVSSPFHMVVIDKESLDKIGPWPWPRTVLAELVDATADVGAKAVLIAEPLDVPDLLSPETIGDFWLKGAQDEALATQLKLLPRTDEVLAQSMSHLPAATGFAQNTYSSLQDVIYTSGEVGQSNGLLKVQSINPFKYLSLPQAKARQAINPVLMAASTSTVLSLPLEQNGVLRRTHTYWAGDKRVSPLIALEAARLALGQESVTIKVHDTVTTNHGKVPKRLVLGDKALNLEGQGTLRLYPPRRNAIAKTSAWKLLNGSASRQSIEGKTVLIGRDEIEGNFIRTARGRFAPVEVHAMIADQITKGISLKRPGYFGYIEAVAVMLLGAGAIMLAQRVMFWQAIASAILGAIVLVGISAVAFFTNGWLFNPLLASSAMFLGALSIAGGRSVGTVLFDDNVRGAFREMLPENAMKAIRDDRMHSVLLGVHRKVSVLACELRITDDDLEILKEAPNNVNQILAAASHNLRQTITKIGGTFDQAEGGRLFAYFNVPLETADYVEKACASALAMIESMDKTNSELAASKSTENVQVHLAIGIATGVCFAGPMGHGRNNRYSVVGPAMDMAAFLRRQSEYYGPAIICSDTIYKDSHHKFAFLELDRLKISLKDKPENIHALIGNPFIKSSKNFRSLEEAHRALLTAYRNGSVIQAREHLDAVKKFPAANIDLFDIYEDRIKTLEETGVPSNWDGVHTPAL